MKRIISALLVLCLLAGTLTWCGSIAADVGMINLTKQLGDVSEGEIDLEISIDALDELPAFLPSELDGAILSLLVTYAKEHGEGTAALEVSIPSPEATVQLTDLVAKDGATYLNVKYLINALSGPLLGGDTLGIPDALDGATYVRQGDAETGDTSEQGEPKQDEQDEQDEPKQTEDEQSADEQSQSLSDIIYRLLTVLFTSVHNLGLAAKEDGGYGFTAEGDDLRTILLDLFGDISEHADIYADTIWNSAGLSNISRLGDAFADLDQDSFKRAFNDAVADTVAALEEGDLSGCLLRYSIAYDKKTASYAYTLRVVNQSAEFVLSGTLSEKTIDPAEAPADALSVDDFIENMERLP